MNEAAAYKLALYRQLKLSAQAEVEIMSKAKSEPLLVVLTHAREAAAEAIDALVNVDAEDAKEIRRLQNLVVRFEGMVDLIHDTIMSGKEAERELNELQIAETRGFVLNEQDAEALGVPTHGEHDDD